jgi:deoxyribonuclease IV
MLARMAKAKVPLGAHIAGKQPLETAKELGADCVQIFLSSPQSWKKPPQRRDAEQLRKSKVGIYVHAPYLINVCSPRNNIRYGSRKILQQTCDAAAEIDAAAVIVHPGHAEDGIAEGIGRWPRTLEMLESEVPVLLENTAGGDHAVARRFDALAKLWDAVAVYDGPIPLGFCFDTCHAHAAGEELSDAVERAMKITGRIDLLHANDSRDPPGTGADRHQTLGQGKMDTEALRGMIRSAVKLAGSPVIVETPRTTELLRADLDFVRDAIAG